jgi:excisionase family DNA binding protein
MQSRSKRQEVTIEPIFLGIDATAKYLNVSAWTVKQLLRRGVLKAKKAGRRTLVQHATIKSYAETLPDARFAPSRHAGAVKVA